MRVEFDPTSMTATMWDVDSPLCWARVRSLSFPGMICKMFGCACRVIESSV